MNFTTFLEALTLNAGYNAALVGIGAALLGLTAGALGCFILLRGRALVSDAVSHATLPGVCLAFIVMAMFGGDGRFLPGLLAGAALSAGLGLLCVDWLTRRTRLTEDAAIGAVLSVSFGIGIVLMTVIQTLNIGKPAGLSGFLLGGAAAMLRSEAETVLVAGLLSALAAFAMRRAMLLTAFDGMYAETLGISTRRTDLAMMGLALAVAVIGLKIVGLILIVALMIIPPVAARFWTERADVMIGIAGSIGALSGYVGTAISASGEKLPTGAVIVLTAASLFALSMLLAPRRGLLASWLAWLRFQKVVHRRQGLLALARHEPLHEPLTRKVLVREGLIRGDGVPTAEGEKAIAAILQDEARWSMARRQDPDGALAGRYDGLTPITAILTADQITLLDQALSAHRLQVAGP
jgi:manganese/zinc/iron transport system permease protein